MATINKTDPALLATANAALPKLMHLYNWHNSGKLADDKLPLAKLIVNTSPFTIYSLPMRAHDNSELYVNITENVYESGVLYLVYRIGDTNAIGSVEIGLNDSTDNGYKIKSISGANSWSSSADGIINTVTLNGQIADLYDVCLFRSNAVGVLSIWFRSKTGQNDIFVPVPPTPIGLKPDIQYNTNDFQIQIQSLWVDRVLGEMVNKL